MPRQIALVTWMNIKGLGSRFASSLVVVVGIAGVVGVLISVLAMSSGLQKTLADTGANNRVLVLRDGATAELVSFLPAREVQLIFATEGIAKTADGQPAASAEMITSTNIPRRSDGSLVDVAVRGVGAQGLAIRPEVKLVDGRWFRPGLREVTVGQAAQRQFRGIDIGDRINISGSDWKVVGSFASGGDSLESGMLTDAVTLMSAYERSSANSVVMVLADGVDPESFSETLKDRTKLLVDVVTEKDYYQRQADSISNLMFIITNVVGGIMAVGALFGALNTMYNAVSTRGREIATLRALGFGPGPVVISVLVESLVLAVTGALLGAILAWLFFSGNLVSFQSIVFIIDVTPTLLATGIAWACAIGALGGLFPAVRAARMPIVVALREE